MCVRRLFPALLFFAITSSLWLHPLLDRLLPQQPCCKLDLAAYDFWRSQTQSVEERSTQNRSQPRASQARQLCIPRRKFCSLVADLHGGALVAAGLHSKSASGCQEVLQPVIRLLAGVAAVYPQRDNTFSLGQTSNFDPVHMAAQARTQRSGQGKQRGGARHTQPDCARAQSHTACTTWPVAAMQPGWVQTSRYMNCPATQEVFSGLGAICRSELLTIKDGSTAKARLLSAPTPRVVCYGAPTLGQQLTRTT